MQGLPKIPADERILVGLEPADDAAVYRVSEDRAIVFTVDVITPIVDDPFTFGRIAATNSISDVYAMGARPLMALNVACFSPKIPAEALREVLAGASEAALASSCPVLGGHTVKDSELKFGLAVVGEVHPDALLTNRAARPGDVLLINKAIGTSALSTALKSGRFGEDDAWFDGLVRAMTTSNGPAAEIARAHGARAATDITGFGLSGHLAEVAEASGVTLRLDHDAIPALPGAVRMLAEGFTCGGAQANTRHAAERVEIRADLAAEQAELLHDPQTSGPLVACVPADQADAALRALREAGYEQAARIGTVEEQVGTLVRVD